MPLYTDPQKEVNKESIIIKMLIERHRRIIYLMIQIQAILNLVLILTIQNMIIEYFHG